MPRKATSGDHLNRDRGGRPLAEPLSRQAVYPHLLRLHGPTADAVSKRHSHDGGPREDRLHLGQIIEAQQDLARQATQQGRDAIEPRLIEQCLPKVRSQSG